MFLSSGHTQDTINFTTNCSQRVSKDHAFSDMGFGANVLKQPLRTVNKVLPSTLGLRLEVMNLHKKNLHLVHGYQRLSETSSSHVQVTLIPLRRKKVPEFRRKLLSVILHSFTVS